MYALKCVQVVILMISIPKKEDLTVEFKSDKKRMPDNDIVEAIVALANTKG